MKALGIKLFLDAADKKSITETVNDPWISGYTTNPSLMRKAGVSNYESYCKELLQAVGEKSISFEVFADSEKEILEQARKIARWDLGKKNLHVKIPISTTSGELLTPVIRELSKDKIPLNITALYRPIDIVSVLDALQPGTSTYLSIFSGRMADAGHDPTLIVAEAASLCRKHSSTTCVLWASTREAYNVHQARVLGCEIITAPLEIITKVKNFGRSLDDLTLDTVRTFKQDADAAGFKL